MRFVPLLALAAILFVANPAQADRYHGVHPIGADDGMCYIELAHVHAYAPYKPTVLFRVVDNRHVFVGDPVAFGYEGERFGYHGHHPHADDAGDDHHCLIDGPHFHATAPRAEASFELKGDIYWFIGERPRRSAKHRRHHRRINRVHADVDYVRPVVLIEPPAAYAGVIVETPSAHVSATATVGWTSILSFGTSHKHHKRCGHSKRYKAKKRKYKKRKKRRAKKRKKRRGKRRWKF